MNDENNNNSPNDNTSVYILGSPGSGMSHASEAKYKRILHEISEGNIILVDPENEKCYFRKS